MLDDNDDTPAGPALPGGQEFDEDDEEGRFFGGGVSRRQEEILDYMDKEGDDAGPERIDAAWMRKTALGFEKRISRNAEMRGKWEDQPEK